ncbi:TPA: hypothetical protein N2D16_002720 [Clostridium botulinum]|nr:hypothetical protein [Clostridium botulinum]HCL4455094.1 hypothetical protein [Clostridium botulinum]
MKNQLQEIKSEFIFKLFGVITQEIKSNNNEDLIKYYSLIIANIDKHNSMFEDILENGFLSMTYINEDKGYTDGDIIVYLNNKTEYNIKLIWKENMVGDCYENEECILTHEYKITKKIIKIVEIEEILEENTDKSLLEQIERDVEKEIKEIKQMELRMKQNELLNVLNEKESLELDIEDLKKELSSS